MVQKKGNWLSHDLTERAIEHQKTMSEILLKRKTFIHRIITGDKKLIHYGNPKRQRVWWDQEGVKFYEVLKLSETITTDRYRQQMIKLDCAVKDKRPQYDGRHDKVILQHDKARLHVAKTVQETLQVLNWEILSHPPYLPDITPSDYH